MKVKQDLATALALATVSLDFPDLNLDHLQEALLIEHIERIISNGGKKFDDYDYLPDTLIAFVKRAKCHAKYFVTAWEQIEHAMPACKNAYEQGQLQFMYDLDRAESDPEDLGYLSQIDFAGDCYAYPSARKFYSKSSTLINWFINGFMFSWRRHFLKDENNENEAVSEV